MRTVNEYASDTREQRLGRYLWRSSFYDGGGWESVESHPVAPGDVRLIAGELFHASQVHPKRRAFRTVYEVSWHRVSSGPARTPETETP